MNILQIFRDALVELGQEKVCEALDLPAGLVSQYNSGKKAPGLATCQKIVDLWGKPEVDNSDGSICDVSYDDGVLNASYCPAEWGKKKAAWEGRDVCLCLPIYNNVPQQTVFTWMALVMKYRMALRMELRGDDSMITRSRNQIAKRFLDTGATWSVWFDSDMVFPFGHGRSYATITNMNHVPDRFLALHTIERLISWKKTIVGGCYWDRRGGGKLIAGGRQAIMNPIPSDNLHAVDFVGTGCVAIHRQVFLDIAKKFPETLSDESLGNECGFFTNIQTNQRMLGEDEAFGKRAANSGHPTYLDLGLCCGHIGTSNVHGIPIGGSKI